MLTTKHTLMIGSAMLAAAIPAIAIAQPEESGAAAGEIIVTAQKREQSINDVGLTIQAATAETLDNRGIESAADLGKLVPGFSYTESIYVTPVYTLRGIGLYDATFGAVPAVAIYNDQVPRNYPIMSDALDLDLERIEVLKGPQGTLFGQSATGGAINYIHAKPTEDLQAGFEATYERFDKVQASVYASGPISSTLLARLAARVVQGGDWQRSISRPLDKNGKMNKIEGRLSLDFKPSDSIRFQVGLTAARDKSDIQAGQFVASNFNIYSAAALAAANANPATRNPFGIVDETRFAALTTPGNPGFDASFLVRRAELVSRLNAVNPLLGPSYQDGALAAVGTPIRGDIRSADWTPGFLNGSNNTFYQGYLRADFDLTDEITVTSISAYADKKIRYNTDLDATRAEIVDVPIDGKVKVFNQELRLSGQMDRFNWIVGGNYDDAKTRQDNFFGLRDYSGNNPFGFVNPAQFIGTTRNDYDSTLKTTALFANGEFEVTDNFTVSGGIRYTKTKQTATYCYNDPGLGFGGIPTPTADFFALFESFFPGNAGLPPIRQGECFVLGDGNQGTIAFRAIRTPLTQRLNEDNISFRVGVDYKFDGGTLLYATVSQGYKAGIFSAIGASGSQQYTPATQEKVVAYEAGFKAPLADDILQINGAVFYYKYSDKQVRGRIADPIFGLLEKLLNVPKSYVLGAEAEVTARPIDGLTLNASASYLKAKVDGSFAATPIDNLPVYNAQGYTGDFDGSKLPFTPKFSANADIQYEFDAGDIRPFIGGGVNYQGKQNTTFGTAILLNDQFEIDSYATFDARLGVAAADESWRVYAFGRNITNKNYTTSITTFLDTRFRFTGRPRTYGLTASFKVR